MASPENSTKARILEAAHTVFVQQGTHRANLKDIAEEADVNQALLHYYFTDKKTLADTVFETVASDFFPRMKAILTSERTIEEKVKTFVPKYIELVEANPYLPSYVVGELNQNPEEMKERVRSLGLAPFEGLDTLDAQLRERAEEESLRRISAEHFVVNLLSLSVFPFVARPMIEAVMDMEEETFDTFVDERKERVPEFFLHGLQP